MSYKVKTDSFEGPFDLLLYLVSRQKVDIGSIAISEIADQYLAEIDRMRKVDLDVASDFLLVAATLLEMKAASLIPDDQPEVIDDLDELTPGQMRDVLVERLVEYKKFKNAAAALSSLFDRQEALHVRPFGPDRSMLSLMPDYLKGTTVDELGRLCAGCFAHRDVFLLQSEHIARRVISLEERADDVLLEVNRKGRVLFSELLGGEANDTEFVVVTFLSLLELFKRRKVGLTQSELFGDIAVSRLEPGTLEGSYGADGSRLVSDGGSETKGGSSR